MAKRILVINLGSTSSKIAVFDDKEEIFDKNIKHSTEDLAPFPEYWDQYEFRKDVILKELEANDIPPTSIDAIACRGGLLPPPKVGLVNAGAYEINDDMIYSLKYHPYNPHPVNMGVALADAMAKQLGIPAYVYDCPTVDEMIPICKVTGQPEMERRGQGHPLNMKAAAHTYAESVGKAYEDVTVAVVHLGGGITMTLHKGGKMIDTISDDEGPICPERSGGLPGFQLIKKMAENHWTEHEGVMYTKSGGLKAYFGTNDMLAVENWAKDGDEKAIFYGRAMALNIAKNLAKLACTVSGQLDAFIITGGLAKWKDLMEWIKEYLSWAGEVVVIPGDNESEGLAFGILRVLNGEEEAQEYVMQDWPELQQND